MVESTEQMYIMCEQMRMVDDSIAPPQKQQKTKYRAWPINQEYNELVAQRNAKNFQPELYDRDPYDGSKLKKRLDKNGNVLLGSTYGSSYQYGNSQMFNSRAMGASKFKARGGGRGAQYNEKDSQFNLNI